MRGPRVWPLGRPPGLWTGGDPGLFACARAGGRARAPIQDQGSPESSRARRRSAATGAPRGPGRTRSQPRDRGAAGPLPACPLDRARCPAWPRTSVAAPNTQASGATSRPGMGPPARSTCNARASGGAGRRPGVGTWGQVFLRTATPRDRATFVDRPLWSGFVVRAACTAVGSRSPVSRRPPGAAAAATTGDPRASRRGPDRPCAGPSSFSAPGARRAPASAEPHDPSNPGLGEPLGRPLDARAPGLPPNPTITFWYSPEGPQGRSGICM